MQDFEYFDEAALLERLSVGVHRANTPVVFLLGSPISAPIVDNGPGVPNVAGIINLIREEFPAPAQKAEFETTLDGSPDNSYQTAFRFLLGRRGQQVANDVIKRAVWKARKPIPVGKKYVPSETTSDEVCRELDSDLEGWELAPAVEAVGKLIAGYPNRFGRTALTTNFDPLIEVSIAQSGSPYFRTVLHRDGNLSQTEGTGCHVIHLHGYWYGSDTLHTPRQLNQPRPRLKASLAALIRGKTLVVSGYGGWDDTFAQALMEVVLDDSAYPEIIWTFKADAPNLDKKLADRLAPGADRGRVSLYANIDCHTFFPRLFDAWTAIEKPVPRQFVPLRFSKIRPIVGDIPLAQDQDGRITNVALKILEGNDEDRPPLFDFCVGRDNELATLRLSTQKIYFIHGLGGQGKSTLAAKYFSEAQKLDLFDLFVWRDCKEEAERLENQLVRIIERLSNGKIHARDIATHKIDVLIELLVDHAAGRRILFLFDNVDHYLDLEANRLTESADGLVEKFLSLESNCKFVFTCRPEVQYPGLPVLSLHLEGLDLASTIELFSNRSAACAPQEIEEAHTFTRGHAFWLDLLAAQVARKSPTLTLSQLLDSNASDAGEMPTATLQSIWDTLAERERVVLRALAESVKPETESRLSEYLKGTLNYNQFMRGLRSLRRLNLIVVKAKTDSADVIELHPLVRRFIKFRFPRQERMAVIDAIIAIYTQIIGTYRGVLTQRPPVTVLQNWTEAAEIDIEAGKIERAFERMTEVAPAFEGGAFPGEFARVAKLLFRGVNWNNPPPAKTLDVVFGTYARILSDLGRYEEVESLFKDFEATQKARDARYIKYCDVRCYSDWVKGAFDSAIEWGKKGQNLKLKTDVDTSNSTDHHLALAQRDSGDIDPALKYFLAGRSLAEVTDPDELDDERSGSHYGNVGRCLHLMGQIDPALTCYRKSAILIERDRKFEQFSNQGYIRQWIGELLLVRGERCTARHFLKAAQEKWSLVFPARAKQVSQTLADNKELFVNCEDFSEANCERYCVAWFFGREKEFTV